MGYKNWNDVPKCTSCAWFRDYFHPRYTYPSGYVAPIAGFCVVQAESVPKPIPSGCGQHKPEHLWQKRT
jgi:hypothetical protein